MKYEETNSYCIKKVLFPLSFHKKRKLPQAVYKKIRYLRHYFWVSLSILISLCNHDSDIEKPFSHQFFALKYTHNLHNQALASLLS